MAWFNMTRLIHASGFWSPRTRLHQTHAATECLLNEILCCGPAAGHRVGLAHNSGREAAVEHVELVCILFSDHSPASVWPLSDAAVYAITRTRRPGRCVELSAAPGRAIVEVARLAPNSYSASFLSGPRAAVERVTETDGRFELVVVKGRSSLSTASTARLWWSVRWSEPLAVPACGLSQARA